MLPGWHQNLEGLEAISQDDLMRDVVLRMCALSQSGSLAPFLVELGVTTARHELVPAMARKWKQINKFVEVMSHALESAGIGATAPLNIVDFGAGKGYLTFALHDWLRRQAEGAPRALDVVGVELRPDLVTLDIEMPAPDGIEVLRRIRRGYPDIRVIMCSSKTASGSSATVDALLSGADDFVTTRFGHARWRRGRVPNHPARMPGLLRLGRPRGMDIPRLVDDAPSAVDPKHG